MPAQSAVDLQVTVQLQLHRRVYSAARAKIRSPEKSEINLLSIWPVTLLPRVTVRHEVSTVCPEELIHSQIFWKGLAYQIMLTSKPF